MKNYRTVPITQTLQALPLARLLKIEERAAAIVAEELRTAEAAVRNPWPISGQRLGKQAGC